MQNVNTCMDLYIRCEKKKKKKRNAAVTATCAKNVRCLTYLCIILIIACIRKLYN